MDPGLFTSGFSGENSKERDTTDIQSQSDNEREISSSAVEMRETEKTHSTQAGSVTIPDPHFATPSDPSKVTAKPLRISDLSAAEIKKSTTKLWRKENLFREKIQTNPL
jgi:hypothetical protein